MKIGNGKHEQNISQISEQKKKLQKDDHFYFTLVQNSYILEKRQRQQKQELENLLTVEVQITEP